MSTSCLQLNQNVGSPNTCTGEIEYNAYGYLINEPSTYVFTVLFGLSCIVHVVQAIKFRTWSMLWTAAACGALEAMGWGGRLGSARSTEWFPFFGGFYNSTNESYFLMQICTLIIAPAFLAAACYIILGWSINHLGGQYSLLRPRLYLIIFVAGDVGSLVIQAIGGGIASAADDIDGANLGADIMLAGIIFQLFIMLGFFTVFFSFLIKLRKGKAARGLQIERKPLILLGGIFSVMFFVFVRSVYRVAELSQGWESDIIHNQPLFIALDGAMMTVAIWLLNFFHPGFYLPRTSFHVKQKPDDVDEKANAVQA